MEVDSKPEATHEELLPQLCGAASAIANTLNELHSSALLVLYFCSEISSFPHFLKLARSRLQAAEDSIHAIRTKVGLQFLQLKQINRELNIGTEDVRRHTALVHNTSAFDYSCFQPLSQQLSRVSEARSYRRDAFAAAKSCLRES
jgi:hypothetical protein